MNHTAQYSRTSLGPPQLHSQHPIAGPLQTFQARFTTANIENLNSVMLHSINQHDEQNNHFQPHIQQFASSEQLKLMEQRKSDNRIGVYANGNDVKDEEPNCPDDYVMRCSAHGTKNCIICTKPTVHTNPRTNKVMVDVSTMTDLEDNSTSDNITSANNWQQVAVSPNTKVAEYLSSLRQFLKLSTPTGSTTTTEPKRRLGDVRIVTSPDGSRLFCCPECHMAYPDKSLLEPHLAGHKIERRFVCGTCGAGLKRKEHLDRHQLCHTDERPYSCGACHKTFKRNEHLARHYVIHSGEKQQVCSECGKAFYRKDHLRKHTQGHLTKRLRAAMAS